MRCDGFFLILPLLLVLPAANAATVYTWVDNSGTVHYSDQPHDHAKAITIQPDTPASTGAADSDKVRSRRERVDAIRAKACEKAKQRLANYKNARRLTTTDANGKTRESSAQERVKAIMNARDEVRGLCDEGGD